MLQATMQQERINVKHVFSEDELRVISKDLARYTSEVNQLEDEKKSIVSQLKAKIDAAKAEINLHASYISNGYKYKYVLCNIEKDFSKGIAAYISTEDKKVLHTRKLQPEEYQTEI
jgi:hypothetical protein